MKALSREAKIITGSLVAAAVLILATALLAPSPVERNETPTTFNADEKGIKAAFLFLSHLGYETSRWEKPSAALDQVDAMHSALVITAPQYNLMANEQQGVQDFARRGGWVLAAGYAAGVMLLPDAENLTTSSEECTATSEAGNALGRVHNLHFKHAFKWKSVPANVVVVQRCGTFPAVMMVPTGKGMIVLWSESAPMSNEGIKQNQNLELLLASLPLSHRNVLFDEYLHDVRDDLWVRARGTPLLALKLQLLLMAGAILFSYARRHGALRELASAPRTSPLEFAHSMGSVYHRGAAGEAAIQQAQRRFYDFLERQCGFGREQINAGPDAVVAMLQERFQYFDSGLYSLLEPVEDRVSPAHALTKVHALYRMQTEIASRVNQPHSTVEKESRV